MLLTMNDSGWNNRCDPPWSDAELEIKIRNAWTYGQNRPGCKSPTFKVERLTSARPEGGWAHMLNNEQMAELFNPSHTSILDRMYSEEEDTEIPEAVDDEGFDFSTVESEGEEKENIWHDVLDFSLIQTDGEYVIYNCLIDHGINTLIATNDHGKTTTALESTSHISYRLD